MAKTARKQFKRAATTALACLGDSHLEELADLIERELKYAAPHGEKRVKVRVYLKPDAAAQPATT
jgi:hypothetical protein